MKANLRCIYFAMQPTGELLQCGEKDQKDEEAAVIAEVVEECHQNGDQGHGGTEEEKERPEDECNSNRSADSPSAGQQ